MRIKFLMRLEQVKVSKGANKNQSIIWQVLAENNFEVELIDFIDRFFEIESTKELDGILTIIDDETVYHSIFIKNNFNPIKRSNYFVNNHCFSIILQSPII